MDHPRIDDEKILDRYLAGELAAEDEALFEEHLFACADCLEKAEWGEEMRRGLRTVAAAHAVTAQERTRESGRIEARPFSPAWLESPPLRRAAFVFLILVCVALSAALLWQQSELGRAREAARWAADRSAIAAAGGLAEPTGDLLVVSLGVERAATPAAQLHLDPEKRAVLLFLELPTPTAALYRATLRDARGQLLWRGEDLEPNLYETLLVALPSSFLEPGEYRITVEGTDAAGEETTSVMAFRVSRAP